MRIVAVVVVAAFVSGACGGQRPVTHDPPAATTLRIASYDFNESKLLAHLYASALEARGFDVSLVLGLGSREVVDPALVQHSVDLVPEYAGAALSFLNAGRTTTPTTSSDAAGTYAAVRSAFGRLGVVTLAPAPAQDQNGFVVSLRQSEQRGWRNISDLATAAPTLVFGGPAECAERQLCMLGLRSVYGLHFREFRPYSNQIVTAAALRTGEIDVGLMDTTSGELTTSDLRLLTDDRGLQPAENVIPVLSRTAANRFGPSLLSAVNAVSARLHTKDLVQMNRAVDIDGADPRAVADAWLRSQHLR